VTQGFHVFCGAVDAAAGLVEADHADGFRGVAGAEFAGEVRVEAFGAEGDEDVDWGMLAEGYLCVYMKRVSMSAVLLLLLCYCNTE
jgi:hypothetical protein